MAGSNEFQVISADSHVVEPPDIFAAGLGAPFRDRAPRLVEHDGGDAWLVDGADPVPFTEPLVKQLGDKENKNNGELLARLKTTTVLRP